MTQQMLSEISMSQSPQLLHLVVLGRQPLEWKLEMETIPLRSLRTCWGGKHMKSCSSIRTAWQVLSVSPGTSEEAKSAGAEAGAGVRTAASPRCGFLQDNSFKGPPGGA